VVCPAIDIAHCVAQLDAPENALYRRIFLRELLALYEKKRALFGAAYPRSRVREVRSVRDFDRAVTGPLWGFHDVDAFYAWVSSASRLVQVNTPTLILRSPG
jgi:predicted alpha/beta-fold hydrolase